MILWCERTKEFEHHHKSFKSRLLCLHLVPSNAMASRAWLHEFTTFPFSHFTTPSPTTTTIAFYIFLFFERTKIKFTAKLSRHSFVTAWLVSMLSHLFYFSLRFHFHIPNSRFSFASSQFQSERPRDRSESCFEYLFMWKLISMAHLPLPTSPFT